MIREDRFGAHARLLAPCCALREETFGDAKEAVSEMMWHKATLADQLSDGLKKLRKHKINVDKVLLKKVKVRKR